MNPKRINPVADASRRPFRDCEVLEDFLSEGWFWVKDNEKSVVGGRLPPSEDVELDPRKLNCAALGLLCFLDEISKPSV